MASKQMVHMNHGQGETSYAHNSSFQSLLALEGMSLFDTTPVAFVPSLSDRSEVQAPEDLRINQIPAYDIDENARRERLPVVAGAYAQQFRKDFTLFLQLRAKELVPEGRMVVSLQGRRSDEPVTESSLIWGTAAQILGTMASEGVIDKEKLDSLYIPVHGPSDEELREIIQEEGSFSITEMRVHDPISGMDRALLTPNRLVNSLRAAFEPIIVQHFGSPGEIMDEFVRTGEKHLSLQRRSQVKHARNPRVMLVVSLTKA
ncbi:unnamed protein product [Triticum turgidum subsp. durum]|uniref:Jasmonate O-methyltransferase n=1 Tax=Triticum turgidum subsp. durum TaxID=4567 RepID=A0A9R0RTS3_TRITD|nr:unnamed protein product [Triticum turgidum subsp. durum]